MKFLLLFLTVCVLTTCSAAQECNLIENSDPTLKNVSYQTVFVTLVGQKDKFNIKFWKFADRFTISCFVVTKDTFCVDRSSSVTFNFNDGTSLTFVSDKKQNCRGELDKDYTNDKAPNENSGLSLKKVVSVDVSGIHSKRTFTADEKTAVLLQKSFNCILHRETK